MDTGLSPIIARRALNNQEGTGNIDCREKAQKRKDNGESLITTPHNVQKLDCAMGTSIQEKTIFFPESDPAALGDRSPKTVQPTYSLEKQLSSFSNTSAANDSGRRPLEHRFPELAKCNSNAIGQKLLIIANGLDEYTEALFSKKKLSDEFLSTRRQEIRNALYSYLQNQLLNPKAMAHEDFTLLCRRYSGHFEGIDESMFFVLAELEILQDFRFMKDFNSGDFITYIKLAKRCVEEEILNETMDPTLFKNDISILTGGQHPKVLLSMELPMFKRWLDIFKFPHPKMLSKRYLKNNEHCRAFYHYLWDEVKRPYITGNITQKSLEDFFADDSGIKQWLTKRPGEVLFTPEDNSAIQGSDLHEWYIDKSQMTYGEEKEFWPDDQCRQYDSGIVQEKVLKFAKAVESRMKAVGIDTEMVSLGRVEHLILIRAGSWQCKIFEDVGAIEVTTTPYLFDQTFEVSMNGVSCQLTAYELFDRFLHKPARELGMTGRSGHKHVDVNQAFNGNAELLFRTWVDMENAAWMATAFEREGRQASNFPYVAESSELKTRLDFLVKSVNTQLLDPHRHPLKGHFKYLVDLKKLLAFFELSYKDAPCNLKHLSSYNIDKIDTRSMLLGPFTTLEFRQFHCPRSGQESRILNKLLAGRFDYLLECQKRREEIDYPAHLPKKYDKAQAALAAAHFCVKAGLTEEEFKQILRIPMTPEAKQVFSS